MKKIRYHLLIILLSFSLTGCFERDSMENITIATTAYPIEYFTNELYEDNATIKSIYPNSVDIETYTLTDKQITDFSKSGLFIYNGLGNERDYAIKMLNKNNNLKIIDAAMGMEFTNDPAELWLDPSNALMLVQNIKNGFHQYLSNPYLKNQINERYETFKIELSELDAELKLTAENAPNKTLVVSNDLFKYLEKYGFTILSLEENENLTDKIISDVSKLMADGKIKYVYIKNNEKASKTITNLISKYKVTTLSFDTLGTKTNDQSEDYVRIMNNNLDLIKKELYD